MILQYIKSWLEQILLPQYYNEKNYLSTIYNEKTETHAKKFGYRSYQSSWNPENVNPYVSKTQGQLQTMMGVNFNTTYNNYICANMSVAVPEGETDQISSIGDMMETTDLFIYYHTDKNVSGFNRKVQALLR